MTADTVIDQSSNVGFWIILGAACICFCLGFIAGGQR